MPTSPISPIESNAEQAVGNLKALEQEQRIKTAARLLEEVQGTVVKVTADGKGCDGFFINDGTEIVTSNDLFQTPASKKNIEVVTEDGKVLKAHIQSQSDNHEEVVLKLDDVKPSTYKALKLGSADDIERRDSVFFYGHRDWQSKPMLALGSVQSHYEAKITGYDQETKDKKHRFIDCVMPPDVGLSGTPLLNANGEVIGMYRNVRPTLPGKTNNVLVRCDDVSELKEVLSGSEGEETEAGDKPTAEQGAAIKERLGKLTKPTVIEFEADCCVYCKKQEPLLAKAEKTYGQDINVVRLNIDKDENADLAAAYGVRGLPYTVFIGVSPDGEILRQETLTGFGPGAFQQLIDQLMADRVKDKTAQ